MQTLCMKLLELNPTKTGRAFLMLVSDERQQHTQYYACCLGLPNGPLFLQALPQVAAKKGDQMQN